jgi:farnesyl diphosphate synthase
LAENLSTFKQGLHEVAHAVETALNHRVGNKNCDVPEPLATAMAHGALGGGKRLRPFLLIRTAGLFGVSIKDTMPAAIALECVHCYSLIHDDLPAMDDDDMRRGRPTVHKEFDEATAILAGDSLLTLAFEILGSEDCHPDPAIRTSLITRLAIAAGAAGMAGGQALDLAAETQDLGETDIRQLQAKKTGALIRFACEAGGMIGGANAEEMATLDTYSGAIGTAFQIKDDLLDIESNAETLGKATGKDDTAGKATLVAYLGVAQARIELDQLISEAIAALEMFDGGADPLRDLALFMKSREN